MVKKIHSAEETPWNPRVVEVRMQPMSTAKAFGEQYEIVAEACPAMVTKNRRCTDHVQYISVVFPPYWLIIKHC